jgi:hypothetical protein
VAFNPLRPANGRGCEFLTYGLKHLRTWVLDDVGQWRGTTSSFGPDKVQNVHCAVFVPAQHPGKAPGDSCIVTGFPDGSLGLWIPSFPTQPGSRYALKRIIAAHEPGEDEHASTCMVTVAFLAMQQISCAMQASVGPIMTSAHLAYMHRSAHGHERWIPAVWRSVLLDSVQEAR